MENVEDPTDGQRPEVGESSRVGEEHAEASNATKQCADEQAGIEQRTAEPTREEPATASGSMGFVLVSAGSADHATADAPAPKATASDELEVEEVTWQGAELVAP